MQQLGFLSACKIKNSPGNGKRHKICLPSLFWMDRHKEICTVAVSLPGLVSFPI